MVADPVVRQMGTVVGSLCHNDPAADWPAVALAARAESWCGGRRAPRTVTIDEFLRDSFTTAVGEGEMAMAVRFPGPGRTDGGRVSEGRTQGRRLCDRRGGCAGVAERRRHDSRSGDRVVRRRPVRRPRRGGRAALAGQKPTADLIRAAADAASLRSAPQADLRGSVEYKKSLAGVLVARGLRQALGRLGVQA